MKFSISETCTCVEAITGLPIEPLRRVPSKYSNVLVCDGTECLKSQQKVLFLKIQNYYCFYDFLSEIHINISFVNKGFGIYYLRSP